MQQEDSISLNIKIQNKSIPNFREYIRPIIDSFIRVLEENFDEDMKHNFYHNISSLKLTKKKHLPAHVSGIFDSDKNEILYGEDVSKEKPFDLFHELFHMSSCVNGNVGFHNKINRCGCGINEGYTELLTRKYFGWDERDYSYFNEVGVAAVINSVIGEERMKSLYMHGDYSGLLIELEHYLGKDAHSFVVKLDQYTRFMTQAPFLVRIPPIDKRVMSLMDFVSKNLAKIYFKKNESLLMDENASQELFLNYYKLLYTWNSSELSYIKFPINASYLLSYLKDKDCLNEKTFQMK